MQENWSFILNVLLLIGVIVAIGRLMKARRQNLNREQYHLGGERVEKKNAYDGPNYGDDIIAVRKLNSQPTGTDDSFTLKDNHVDSSQPRLIPDNEVSVLSKTDSQMPKINLNKVDEIKQKTVDVVSAPTVMMFLLAKEGRQFAGYELLQTILAAGLRFGENSLFHLHQFTNEDGAILCSLAAATATGTFDLQNIGAFSVRGLCLYMQATNDSKVDAERFSIMLDTARQLSDGLDAHLLDSQRRPLTAERIARYYEILQLHDTHVETAFG